MKLSDFKGDRGMEVTGKLLIPMLEMFANPDVAKAIEAGVAKMLSVAMLKTPKAMTEIMAILNDKPVEDFEMDGGVALNSVFDMLNDPALQRLFGLQS